MFLVEHQITQPSLDTPPIWTTIITTEVSEYNSLLCRLHGKVMFLC
jgi:hypothetical protein